MLITRLLGGATILGLGWMVVAMARREHARTKGVGDATATTSAARIRV
jgi:hypothetical protein